MDEGPGVLLYVPLVRELEYLKYPSTQYVHIISRHSCTQRKIKTA